MKFLSFLQRGIAFVFVSLCVLPLPVQSQTVLVSSAEYRYILGTSEPPLEWNSVNFDDSAWNEGYSVIGFGNHNDSTVISPVTSVYIRMEFLLEHANQVTLLNLMADYSDGYIAYINGVEVLRVNMGQPHTPVAFNEHATRAREIQAVRNQCYPLLGYYIDTTVLQNSLRDDKNVLAIQVHTAADNASNLSFSCLLSDISTTAYNPYQWEFRAKKQILVDSTKLPIVKIYTDEKGVYDCNKKVSAFMEITHYEENEYNFYADLPNDYVGYIGIEPRGQSSLHWPKKNYAIELRDEDGNDINKKVLGMPKEDDWVLHGPFADRSQIRNALAYDLSSKLGQYAPRTRFCELFINDEYYGIYVFIERIKRDNNRVNIRKLEPHHVADVTGGYIIRLDKGGNTGSIQIFYPKADNITQKQKDYITGFYRDFRLSLHDSVIMNPERGYQKYIDIESYIDFTIINELARNPDAYLYSTYMYKDTDDVSSKLHFGPVWDFDLAFGNSTFQNARTPYGWQFAQRTNRYLYHTSIFKDTAMVRTFSDRWFELRNTVLHADSIMATIDSLLLLTQPAVERNKDVWKLENNYILSAWGQYITYTYEEDVLMLKDWVLKRVEWIDNNIESIYYPYTYNPPLSVLEIEQAPVPLKIFPTVVESQLFVEYTMLQIQDVSISMYNAVGLEVYRSEIQQVFAGTYVQAFPVEHLMSGTYTVIVRVGDSDIYSQNIVKK